MTPKFMSFLATYLLGASVTGLYISPRQLDPSQVHIDGITAVGSGCPAGSVSAFYSSNSIGLSFDSYTVYYGPGVSIIDRQKSCQISINLVHPPEYHYSIDSITYHGYFKLDSKVTETQRVTFFFTGETKSTKSQFSVTGPIVDVVTMKQDLNSTTPIYSPCGSDAALNLNSTINKSSTIAGASQQCWDDEDCEVQRTWIIGISWSLCR